MMQLPRSIGTLVLAAAPAIALGQASEPPAAPTPAPAPAPAPTPVPPPAHADKPAKATPAPFYRQYMIPGQKLDDKILEQERRVDASPQDANLRNDFGNLLALRRFPAQAAEQYEIALKLDPKNFISAYNLGLLRETEGKLSAAASAYQKSIKRKPGFPQSRFRLGRVYEHMNDPEAAVKQYAAAMWIDPGIRDARRNPLVVDSELMYLASLANYQRDIAAASMNDGHVYFENDRFRKLPTDRAISAKEIETDEDSDAGTAPREVGMPNSAGGASTSSPAGKNPSRPGNAGSRPTSPTRPRATRPITGQPVQPNPVAATPADQPEPAPAGTEMPPEPAPETPPGDVEPS